MHKRVAMKAPQGLQPGIIGRYVAWRTQELNSIETTDERLVAGLIALAPDGLHAVFSQFSGGRASVTRVATLGCRDSCVVWIKDLLPVYDIPGQRALRHLLKELRLAWKDIILVRCEWSRKQVRITFRPVL